MMEHDLHPGRPEEVLFSIACYSSLHERYVLRSQLANLYSYGGQRRAG